MSSPTAPAVIAPDLLVEWDVDVSSTDPLRFPGYMPPAGEDESVRTGLGRVGGRDVAVIHCRFDAVGGTMGVSAGERVVRALRRATQARLPIVEIVSSGGARLQEGMPALVQMARTVSAVRDHRAAGLLSVAVLLSPTTGGVYASWASLADLKAAEPGAVIGFGGPRVVAQVTGEVPTETSHSAEAARQAGLIDEIIPRDDVAAWLEAVLGTRRRPLTVPADRPSQLDRGPVPADGWEVLLRSRAAARPSGLEWAAWLTDSWVELAGYDDSIRAGLGSIGPHRAIVVAMDRHAFGDAAARPGPGAYRLARRAIGLCDRLGLPIVTIVDTPGAEPGPDAERGGIAREIAEVMHSMAACRSTTIALVVGEGGSGGAMALAHADHVIALSGSVFSVIGPEAGAAILYRDPQRAAELARDLRMTAAELAGMGIVDEVLDEDAADVRTHVRNAVLSAMSATSRGYRDERLNRITSNYISTTNGYKEVR